MNVQPLRGVFGFALVPMLTVIAGGAFAVIRPPGAKFRSYIQHLAAGVVFSVVAVELLPDIVKKHLPWEVAIGFSAGVAVMLGLKAFTGKLEAPEKKSSLGLITGVAIDVFIDGILIGIGFTAGSKEGMLLTIALAVELLSLGLAVASSLVRSGAPRCKTISMVAGISIILLVAAILGTTILAAFSAETMEVLLAFGLAALLFLVTEELLVEAHEEPETPAATAMFFAGFLLFLVIGMVS